MATISHRFVLVITRELVTGCESKSSEVLSSYLGDCARHFLSTVSGNGQLTTDSKTQVYRRAFLDAHQLTNTSAGVPAKRLSMNSRGNPTDRTTAISAVLRMKPVSFFDDPPVILVVDDDPLMRQLLRRVMEKEGYQVVEAANGEQGLEAYKRLKPHLVLLDALMPVMDGFTCCTQLQILISDNSCDGEAFLADSKHEQGVSRTPVLMITGLDDPESVDRAFAVGATDYVMKPIHFPVLRQRVRRLIQQAQLYQQLKLANRELKRLAALDGLTGVANRRRFDEYLDAEWNRMAREKQPLSLILCDIDFFKKYNDSYGHQAGDDCLRRVADALRFCAKRSVDLVARYGGEEFAVILPNTTADGAFRVAEEIRAVVNSLEIAHAQSAVSQHVTLSLGIACMHPTPDALPAVLIAAADTALYQAKAAGRNRSFPQIST